MSYLFLLLLAADLVWAAGGELQPGKAQDDAVAPGATASYPLAVKAGDFVETKIEPRGTELLVVAYDPSGARVRASKAGPEGRRNFAFVAETSGGYRLDVAAADKSSAAKYTITLSRIVSLADRLSPAAPAGKESTRMKTLRAAIDGGSTNAVQEFWEEVKVKGAPLIEPLEGDEKRMLVTFVWKGTADTRSVAVVWSPFSDQWPDDYQLKRLGTTDVWYRSIPVDRRKRFAYRLAPNAPALHASQEAAPGEIGSMAGAISQVDPLNPKHWAANPEDPELPIYRGVSMVEMPGAPPQPWIEKRSNPAGEVRKSRLASALLKNEREVAVYTPAGYSKDAKPYDLLVVFDEKSYLNLVPTPTILDNLIAENRIAPTVAVLLDNAPGARSRELPCNPAFADFLNFEVIPWVRRGYNVTADPHHVVVAGSSYGGLASAYAAFRHPETFGNVLSQSGSYWWTPPRSAKPDDFDPDAEPNWLPAQFAASPRLPVRFYLDAGSDELDFSGHGSHILVPSRRMRDVLLAKGYEVHYQEFNGGHDYLSWRGTLADGLILLMGAQTLVPASR